MNARAVAAGCAVVVALAGPARAERVRYHFTPADLSAGAYPQNAGGQRVSYFGGPAEPYPCPKRPTHLVTFRHPYTGANVTLPLALPDSTPRVEHRRDRIVFNYGDYTVSAVFHPDGSVDAVYDSGILRPLR